MVVKSDGMGSECGWIPVKFSLPAGHLRKEDLDRMLQDSITLDFQMKELYGMTVQELVDLDAITKRQLKPSTLDLENRHPLFRKENWDDGTNPKCLRICWTSVDETSGGASSEHGIWLQWLSTSPTVWQALLPCLALASHMISASYLRPFVCSSFPSLSTPRQYLLTIKQLDALMFGEQSL